MNRPRRETTIRGAATITGVGKREDPKHGGTIGVLVEREREGEDVLPIEVSRRFRETGWRGRFGCAAEGWEDGKGADAA